MPVDPGLYEADREWPQILKNAYTLYKQSRVGVSKSYSRFAEDMVNSVTFKDCETLECKNAHIVNLTRLKSLFSEANENLVRKYFDKERFTDEDCLALIAEFNLLEDSSASTLTADNGNTRQLPNFQCRLTNEQISIITKAANAAQIFLSVVTETEVKALFDCSLTSPLKSGNNRTLAMFFDELSRENIICTRWQNVLDRRKLIISAGSDKPLNKDSLSSALSGARNTENPTVFIIRQMARDVARLQEKA